MYADPRDSRRNVVATRVNDHVQDWLHKAAAKRRTQPATLVHDLIAAAMERESQLAQGTSSLRI